MTSFGVIRSGSIVSVSCFPSSQDSAGSRLATETQWTAAGIESAHCGHPDAGLVLQRILWPVTFGDLDRTPIQLYRPLQTLLTMTVICILIAVTLWNTHILIDVTTNVDPGTLCTLMWDIWFGQVGDSYQNGLSTKLRRSSCYLVEKIYHIGPSVGINMLKIMLSSGKNVAVKAFVK